MIQSGHHHGWRICLLLLMWPFVAQTQTTPYQWHLQTGLAAVPPASFRPTMAYDTVHGVSLCIPTSSDDFPGTWGDGTEAIGRHRRMRQPRIADVL